MLAALTAGSVYLTVEMESQKPPSPAVQPSIPSPVTMAKASTMRWERLTNPNRSVLRDNAGATLATFTDGARTATLAGPSRTFAEPAHTSARVVTTDWVRLMPAEWHSGAEREQWFQDWFKKYQGSKEDDLFAMAFQYVDRAPEKKDADGVPYAGDAAFGPLNPHGSPGNDLRIEQSDFYDYLGTPYTFRDGKTLQPERSKYRAMDCAGFIRTVLGYRARYPLMSSDSFGTGLPRTANGMARSKVGADIIPLTPTSVRPPLAALDTLQPGDLVFFKLDRRTGDRLDHVAMYMGPDTDGHKIFISSREEVNGPTIGDVGGTSRLDGNGYYAERLRSAKRV
ncbi:C40 family peptidase [Streptomyces sp. NPDC016734]